ncbi:polyprenyl synthetase family protein [Corynebacterium gallinarum]|uniref:Polyprenyl synthetase family protein n=1 Tax=Corynebacterium gallinarum TaxID=2762214 RepID=A0A8I0HNZ1_9CORY|nr:polyprenyl synthetase family protein [Corynebacterium gallinarum]MBD8029393.1 polyprenyl synthetase family protein [Corynebacterium gallinarum]
MDNGMTLTTEQSAPPGFDVNEEIYRELNRTFSSLSDRCRDYGPDFRSCLDTAFQALRGGKLIRPRMLLGTHRTMTKGATGRTNHDAALQIAVATELLHFSFLVHDDVIDGDLYRRGKLNFIGQILKQRDPDNFSDRGPDPEHLHWACSNGILIGNLFLAATHQVFARVDLPHPVRLRLLDLLEHTMNDSLVGEFLDVGLSSRAITPDISTALEMSRLKTATYTFELPLRAAAILAGLSEEDERRVGVIGTHLGTAYQLQDDYLSTFGEAAEHGKDSFSDLREGKETTIIGFARATRYWKDIEVNFNNADLTTEQGEHIRDLLIRCGAEEYSRDTVRHHLDTCRASIEELRSSLNREVIDLLLTQVDQLDNRRS